MIKIRRDSEIYRKEGGWFTARWHFSFDEYRDPENMGFGPLRVFNDDRLIAGADWPMHPHRDIEGITYVVEGTFEHLDSLGNDGQLPPGSIQRATLGSGMYHSERNGSQTEPMRFLQFWILPHTANLPPENVQRVYRREDRTDKLLKVLGPDGGDDRPWVKVHQDATVHIASLSTGNEITHELGTGRGAYLYLISGGITLNDEAMATGDAAQVAEESALHINASQQSELILVDLPLDWTPVGVWARYGS
ncbi:MAG TPA: pirin family protein [Dehalococcoidia bacterium]|nr:pirin family protein [Dehalococcoidia bacterium]